MSAALSPGNPRTADTSDTSVDDAHLVGVECVRSHAIRSASPPNRRNLVAVVDGEIAASRSERLHLPRLQANDSTGRDVRFDKASVGNP